MRALIGFVASTSLFVLTACEARESNAAAPTEVAPPTRVEVPPPAVTPTPEPAPVTTPEPVVQTQPEMPAIPAEPIEAAAKEMETALAAASTRVATLRQSVTQTCNAIEQLGESATQELKDASVDLTKRIADVDKLEQDLRAATLENWSSLDQGLDAVADELDETLLKVKAQIPH